MSRASKCYECKKELDNPREAIKFDSHYYHPRCYASVLARRQFISYVCKLFDLLAPGPKIYKQRTKLIKDGYDDEGIVQTLKYIYEVKKLPIPKDEDLIGLGQVPRFYREAEAYWEHQQTQQQMIARGMADAIEQEKKAKTVVISKPTEKKKVQLLDLVEPEGEDT